MFLLGFVKAGGGLAGEIIPTSQPNTGMPMPGVPATSTNPGFSSFSGKGTSLSSGTAAPVVPTSISSADAVPNDQ